MPNFGNLFAGFMGPQSPAAPRPMFPTMGSQLGGLFGRNPLAGSGWKVPGGGGVTPRTGGGTNPAGTITVGAPKPGTGVRNVNRNLNY